MCSSRLLGDVRSMDELSQPTVVPAQSRAAHGPTGPQIEALELVAVRRHGDRDLVSRRLECHQWSGLLERLAARAQGSYRLAGLRQAIGWGGDGVAVTRRVQLFSI